jgi:hypothetical protein
LSSSPAPLFLQILTISVAGLISQSRTWRFAVLSAIGSSDPRSLQGKFRHSEKLRFRFKSVQDFPDIVALIFTLFQLLGARD